MPNPNFYNNICGNNATFQSLPTNFVPPPPVPPPPPLPPVPPAPLPPPFFIPPSTPASKREKADQDTLKSYEQKIPVRELTHIKLKPLSISEVRNEIRKLLIFVNDLKSNQEVLMDKVESLSDEEWNTHVAKIEENKALINKTLSQVNGPNLDMLRKVLAKRKTKRLRLKRNRMEKKRDKEEILKELKERSRKIDENLQKIQDDINNIKKDEEAKLQADMVLKEVLRKKGDAKKCITKLDALMKLRKARQNTAKGRGENVSESEGDAFNSNIERLRSLWARKLILYEKEEADLRAQLKEEQKSSLKAGTKQQVVSNLDQWWETLFGGKLPPQVDFGGDLTRFVTVRTQWDKYISSNGTPLPVGWVPPTSKTGDAVREAQ